AAPYTVPVICQLAGQLCLMKSGSPVMTSAPNHHTNAPVASNSNCGLRIADRGNCVNRRHASVHRRFREGGIRNPESGIRNTQTPPHPALKETFGTPQDHK